MSFSKPVFLMVGDCHMSVPHLLSALCRVDFATSPYQPDVPFFVGTFFDMQDEIQTGGKIILSTGKYRHHLRFSWLAGNGRNCL